MVWVPDDVWYKQKKGKGKGGGKWGGGSSWGGSSEMDAMMAMMPMMMAMQQGQGWGVKKWHKKDKKPKTKFSDLPEERKAEILAKQAEKAAEEGRKPVGNLLHDGTIVKVFYRGYGWIKPTNMFKLPKLVKDKMKEMTAEKKANAEKNKHEGSFEEELLYFRKNDVEGYPQIKLQQDMAVKFKVYVDEKGAGAFAVVPPEEAKME
mmetsp:Transcript_62636/g.109473  ORF Transcript_62636/g.109473 Transcript_62636/m.109473 type:complete len:205 (+) Transcript_62636:30-644(+)